MTPQFKLISSNSLDLFEERMNEFAAALPQNTVIVDINFSTSAFSSTVEYSALIHYQKTESWD